MSPASARPRGSAPDPGQTRVVRVLALMLAVAVALSGVIALPSVVAQSVFLAPAWTVFAVAGAFVLPIATGVAAFWLPLRAIRCASGLAAAAQALAMLTLEPALLDGVLPLDRGAPWIIGYTTLATIAAALAWPPIVVWPFVALVGALVGVDRVLASPQPIADVAIQDALVALLVQTVFTSLALVSVRAGRRLDTAREHAARESVAAARIDARDRERAGAEALLHDAVLSTLLLAGRPGRASGTLSAEAARTAIERIDHYRADETTDPRSPSELVWALQAVTTSLDPDTTFRHRVVEDGGEARRVPGEVADALSAALTEALGNSIRHAGRTHPPTRRTVTVHADDGRVSVRVQDDGPGFDPSQVPTTRLGIAYSVVARMERVGGRAVVTSAPGHGTLVTLDWAFS